MKHFFPFLLFLILAGCGGESGDVTGVDNHPLAKVDEETRPTFQIEPAQPFRIEFGRGSGWEGLDTVTIVQDGTVTLHRSQFVNAAGVRTLVWDKATIKLSKESLGSLLQAVEENRLLHLHKAYHADVHDGTQWVLWISQGDKERSVYFNNHFPKEIIGFAKSFDAVLAESGLDKAAWQRVPANEARGHEKELWDSIK